MIAFRHADGTRNMLRRGVTPRCAFDPYQRPGVFIPRPIGPTRRQIEPTSAPAVENLCGVASPGAGRGSELPNISPTSSRCER
jgi:hypothetical protein